MKDQTKSKTASDQILLITNISHMVMIVITLGFFMGLLTDLGTDDGSMRWAVAAGVILFSDLAFVGIVTGLIIIARSTEVTFGNMANPIITIIVLTLISLKGTYEWFLGPVSDPLIGWLGISASIILLAWMYFETAQVKKRLPMDATM